MRGLKAPDDTADDDAAAFADAVAADDVGFRIEGCGDARHRIHGTGCLILCAWCKCNIWCKDTGHFSFFCSWRHEEPCVCVIAA